MRETTNAHYSLTDQTQQLVPLQQNQQLMGALWLLVASLIVWHLYALVDKEFTDVLGSAFISACALLPVYLWCSGKTAGMPIFPLYSLTFLWTYAFPLLGEQRSVIAFDADARFFASISVTAFLLLGTAVWYCFATTFHSPPEACLAMTAGKGDRFFMFALLFSVLFTIANSAGWLIVSYGIFSIIRGVVMGLHALAVFVLAYRWGRNMLTRNASLLLLVLLITYGLASASSLLLIGSMTTFVLAVVSFTLGRQRIPWKSIAVIILCFALLHAGKSQMRGNYWFGSQTLAAQPWNYPMIYAEWFDYAVADLTRDEYRAKNQSLLERSSLMHLLLKVQQQSPDTIPFLYGKTYTLIPELFIPRILKSDKITSHEGTYLLNIHYGLQTRADTLTTTIGWGLLNEAYANFGLAGCAGLAVFIGALYGKVTSWSRHAPVLSMRSFVALLFLSFSMQSEFTAGYYVAAVFQSLVVLGSVVLIFMQRQGVAGTDRLG